MALLLLLTSGGCGGGGSDAPKATPDVTPPAVDAHYPEQVSGGVKSSDIQTNGIYVTFNEPLKETTVTNATFIVVDGTRGGVPVNGNVSYLASSNTARFMPATPLTALFNYTVTVTTGVEDLAGNHLSTPYTWQFSIAGPSAPPPPPL